MISSVEDLQAIVDKRKKDEETRNEELRVCIGSSCSTLGSTELQKDLAKK